MATSFPAVGEHIGRFRVLAQLGAGGMGVVYDALEVNLERRVALKVISPLFADDARFRERFAREARALASLDSPHVVQVYAHGEEDGHLYIATQLIPDGDLGQLVDRWGPPPVGRALGLIAQAGSGLADAHDARLVHRDIKPANVLVRRRGATEVRAYLGDFGIARRTDAEATVLGSIVAGTPLYMAPELHGGGQATPASDIYSLGCLLWVVLTGEPPFTGRTELEVVGGHVTKPVPQISGHSPLVGEVNRILRRAMAKDPRDRYPTSAALRDDVARAAAVTDPAHAQTASTAVAEGATVLAPAQAARPQAPWAEQPGRVAGSGVPLTARPAPGHAAGAVPVGPVVPSAAQEAARRAAPPEPVRAPVRPPVPVPGPPAWAGTPSGRAGGAGGGNRLLLVLVAAAVLAVLVGGMLALLLG